jgi:hypothetical protein
MIIKKSISLSFFLITFFFLTLSYFTTIPPIWDYDAYGSIITHIELDDVRFENIYISYLLNIGFSEGLANLIFDYLFPIFIIPIRWTYALGISPLYGISRFLDLDWSALRLIFLSIHIAIATLGLKFIFDSLKKYYENYIFIYIISFIFLSPAFIYWTLSLTPYSFHLFCFGLLIKHEFIKLNKSKFISKKSLTRSFVQILNYQYIPIVFVLGLYDFFKHPKNFFINKKIKNWILPGLTSLFSLIFLFLRSKISGKHSSPNLSILNELGVDKYNIWQNSNGFFDGIHFFLSRYLDLFLYYFNYDEYYLLLSTQYGNFSSIFIFIFLLIFFYNLFKKRNKIIIICFLILGTSTVFYLLNIYPFMPSRHSLVLFLPFTILFSIFINNIISHKPFLRYFSFVLFIFSLIFIFKNFTISTNQLNIKSLISVLEINKIDRIVLIPCNQEPLFYNNQIKPYKPLYKCGPQIIEKINPESLKIAVYSKNDLSKKNALKNISYFLNNNEDLEKFQFIKKINLDSLSYLNGKEITHSINIFHFNNNTP